MPRVNNIKAFSDSTSAKKMKQDAAGTTEKLATHVPDIVLQTGFIPGLPYSQKFEGILLFADISGFTALCERYSMDSRSANGTDKLSRTLNSYLSDIIDNIMGSEGDILKFAGDAFMCLWRVKNETVDKTINRVIQCGLRIQQRCDNRHTDIGVNLRVKLGVSIGSVRVITVGNDENRHYVLSGPAVDDANTAEKFSTPGTFVLSPKAWAYTPDHDRYEHVVLADDKHVRILAYYSTADENDTMKMTVNEKIAMQMSGNYSTGLDQSSYTQQDVDTAILSLRRASMIPTPQELAVLKKKKKTGGRRGSMDIIQEGFDEDAEGRERQAIFRATSEEEKTRLRRYIIKPVLQKIDDDLPLEYLSEMRQVSVLFINLIYRNICTTVDSTDNNERTSLQRAFTPIYDTAKEFQGCLNKVFMFDKGCTYIVIFGLPGFKHEDDCSRALRSAYSTSSKLKEIRDITQVSIGVTSGSSFCGVVGHVHRHEYTVIGKKVNMAARLMMHYPGKVSCDPETFHHSKLPRQYFHELPHKEMKGVRNPGVIHEFIERDDYVPSTAAAEVPMFQYPLLGRDDEMSTFLEELHNIEEKRQGGRHIPFIFIHGDPGIGKTRFLDAAIEEALKDNDKVISCALSMNDTNTPYFIVRSLISMLLGMENCKSHVEREHQILSHIQDERLREELCLLNDLLIVKFPVNPKLVHMDSATQTTALHNLIRKIVHMFTSEQCIIFAVDDVHFMDNDSWEFLNDFAEDDSTVCILTSRPNDKYPCQAAEEVFKNIAALHLRLRGLESEYMAPLACQLLEVTQVPEALVKILKEKSHGVPSWVEQLIREMVAEEQLLIMPLNSKDVPGDSNEVFVTPSADVLKKRPEGSVGGGSQRGSRRASIDISSTLAQPTLPASALIAHLQQLQDSHQRESDKPSMVCIVAPGVDLDTVQIPDSMKGMILTRIDHMKPSEQMIVKCASVLGMIFKRKMLEVISPTKSTWKIRRLLHGLMQSGVFECAASYFNSMGVMQPESMNKHKGSRHHIGKSSQIFCLCPEAEDQSVLVLGVDIPAQDKQTQPISNCRYLRFTSSLMQETAYDLFLSDQRRRLHRTAALYLEAQAHKCDACGGGEFLPGNELGNAGFVGHGPVSLNTSSSHTNQTRRRRMGVDGEISTEPTEPTEVKGGSHFSMKQKTSLIIDAMQNTMKRHKATIHSQETLDENVDIDASPEIDAAEEEEMKDSMPELPPVQMEVLARRGRRNTITVHRSSVVAENFPEISESCISIKDELEKPLPYYEDEDGLAIESTLDFRECSCLSILNEVFPHLVRHWKAAGNTDRTIIFLAEAGGAAIATGNNITALSLLKEANEIIAALDRKQKPLPDDPEDNIVVASGDRARIKSMTGQALFRLGRFEESIPHFLDALRKLKNSQPASKRGFVLRVISETIKQLMHAAFPSLFVGSASSNKCNRFVEQARCLSFLWEAHHKDNHALKALAAALQEINRAESADDDLKELVSSYTNMMQCCQSNKWHKLGDYYERLAMKRCVDSPSAVGPDDLVTIGYLYCSSMEVRLANGRIQGAIDTGFSTLKIAKKLHDVRMELRVLPLLTQTLLLADRHTQALEMINKLFYAAEEEENHVAMCFYHSCCMDLALCTGFLADKPEKCENFCLDTADEPSFSFDASRFYLMTCLALWFGRKALWDKSEEWLIAADKIKPRTRHTYITAYGTFKIAECKLLHYLHEQKIGISSAQAAKEAKTSLMSAKATMAEFPVFKPRYLHLFGYLHLLNNNEVAASKHLKRSMVKSTSIGNLLELNWAKHNLSLWEDKYLTTHHETFWTRSYQSDMKLQPNIANAKLIKFSLPHPKWQVES